MIRVPTRQPIKIRQGAGESISSIAQPWGIDRKTVRQYGHQTDFSPQTATPEQRPSRLDSSKVTIDGWLDEGARHGYQQRPTSQRIDDRLREEFPDLAGSYRTVRRSVQHRRPSLPTTGTLDLVWHAGEAQVDFGPADVLEHGDRVRLHCLWGTVPYGNAGYLQLFRGATAECVGQGLADIFPHIGGAPHRLVFDNATGVGRRTGETVRLPARFQRCQAHYAL
jgi:transposase